MYRDGPASAEQLATALVALGAYAPEGNTPAEHAAAAARLGPEVYVLRLANVLLGAAQAEAVLAEQQGGIDADLRGAAHREQLRTGGVLDPGSDVPDPHKLAEFLRYQILRVAGPLREIAQDPATGPIPLAAAHGAEGLGRLLAVVAAGQVPTVENMTDGIAELRAARACFERTIANIDILVRMLDGLDTLFDT